MRRQRKPEYQHQELNLAKHALSERIASILINIQKKLSRRISSSVNRLSRKQLIILSIFIGIIWIVLSANMLVDALTINRKQGHKYLDHQTLAQPLNNAKPADVTINSISPFKYQQLLHLSNYLDSLSKMDGRTLDSLVTKKPQLLDSIEKASMAIME
jgi:hypothetical protein